MENDIANRILDAASRLFLEYGYKRTTVEEIAVASGISKGGVYLHFQSKEEIFGAASERLCRDVLARSAEIAASDLPVEEKLHNLFLEALLYVWDFCHQAPHAPGLWMEVLAAAAKYAVPAYEESRKIIAQVIAQGQGTGRLSGDLDPLAAARLLQIAMNGFELPYVLIEDRRQIDTEMPKLLDLLIRGLASDRDTRTQ